MKTPFIKTFRKKYQNQTKAEILDLFLTNISGTNYSKVEREGDTRLIIEGPFHKFFYNNLMTLWVGFCRKAVLYFDKNNYAVYSVDYTYGAGTIFLALLIFIIGPFFIQDIDKHEYFGFLMWALPGIIVLGIFHNAYRLFLHRQVFIDTVNSKNRFKGSYDWSKILKEKSDKELKDLINGKTTLTAEVQKMAKEELISRKAI